MINVDFSKAEGDAKRLSAIGNEISDIAKKSISASNEILSTTWYSEHANNYKGKADKLKRDMDKLGQDVAKCGSSYSGYISTLKKIEEASHSIFSFKL